MPYLPATDRKQFDRAVCELVMTKFDKAGQLNYLFTEILLLYVKSKGESYQTYNDCIGALEACKLELYRRRVADYEHGKVIANGDVY